ncbi:uncharacterized protein [Asterias amurensis]|uniref:uncharacterized protein n=1 Tax=Asterias amurensis TaxID=7602 RepID=UPI003AB33F47
MPASGGISRIGVYGCQATVTGQSTNNIGTVIMSSTAHFVPTAISQTVNLGEAVRLTVTGSPNPRWRKDSSGVIWSSNDNLYYDINGASNTDAGTYEVQSAGVRLEGRQALMRLLVRGCQQERWGASCNEICPVCLNGGVCDDVGGLCICPPGFSGDICEIVLGPKRFGKDGSLYCDSGVLPDTTSCEGLLFCLPDPFGCICGAGYKGIDCNTECDDGTFGANCAQMCHCSGQVSCDKTTGRCLGNCASGYKGINCQDACGAGVGGLNCATSCEVPAVVTMIRDVAQSISTTQIHLAWKFVSNLCAVERYQIEYEQTYCQGPTSQRVEVTADLYADSLVISSGLQPFSSYTVYIKAWNEIGAGPETSISVTTGESVPTGEPENVILSTGQTNSLSFTWDPIPCGFQHGSIVYQYKLQQKDVNSSREGQVASEAVTVASGLLPCTDYIFQVAGVTSAGQGPYSFALEARTTEQAPNPVEGLNLRSSANGIQVSWPASTGTAINPCTASSYIVTYELLNSDQCDPKENPFTVNVGQVDTTSTSISGLEPYSSYRVNVKATNTGGDSSNVGDTVITAEMAPSGPPRDIQLTLISNTTLSSSWDQPECGSRHGVITQYSYTLTSTDDGAVIRRNTTIDTSLELTDLIPFTQYTLSVAAMTSFGSGPVAVITNLTNEGIPPSPDNIYFPSTFSDHITVGWTHPSPPHGIILSYEIRYWKTESETSSSAETLRITDNLQDDHQTKDITNLESNMGYSFQVRAETSVGFGAWSNIETAETVPGTPSKPQLLMVSSVTETSISLSWSHPMQPNGNMLVYKIEHRVVSKPYDSSFTFDQAGLFETQDVSDISDLSGTVMNLEPSTEYELQVYGINEADITGDKANILHFTAFATDLPPPETPSIIADESTKTSIAIRLVATATSKYITAYQIGVQMTSTVSRRSAPAFGHYRDNPSAYIAAELDDGLPETFVVGDNKEYGSYWNPPLQEGAAYKIYVGAVSRINETEANVVWSDDPLTAEAKLPSTTPSTLIIVICVVIAAIVIVVGVICYTRRRRKRRRKNPLQHPRINAGHELVSYENAVPREEKPTSAPIPKEVSLVQESVYEPVGPGSSARRDALPAPPPSPAPAPAPAPESQPTYEDVGLPTWANPWSVMWDDLIVGIKVLGNGQFGEVHYGSVMFKGVLCKAAIKTLKENATHIDRENFLEELKTMTLHGSHPNLVKIMGACQHEGILYVAMEYLSNGDLRCFLRKARSMEDDGQASLSPQKLLQFALDVAKGMQHLAAYGVIHRDLAARNILLDDNLVAKVSDFGLSRGEDVYVQTSKTRVPTRWLSLESLTHQTYTSKSDVWSFGILLWEIATLGGTPYPGIKTPFLTSRLENGYRMPKPDNSDDKIYELMLQCWQEDPNSRPSFKKLVSDLETMDDSKEDQIYMRLLPSSEKYLYVNIHPELDDN